MNLMEIVDRKCPAVPWLDGERLPWNEPELSEHILQQEHLDQKHDRASRRLAIISAHVEWLIKKLRLKAGDKVLDLTCGPGLYCHEFGRRGIRTVGVDFSPASIKHAQKVAEEENLDAEFILKDIRDWEPAEQFDAVIFVYGQPNAFEKKQLRRIMFKINRALTRRGMLAAEIATENYPKKIYEAIWSTDHKSLWGDFPQICLEEDIWDEKLNASLVKYYVINALTGEIKYYSQCHQFYSVKELFRLHKEHGLRPSRVYGDLEGRRFGRDSRWMVMISRKKKDL